MANVSELLANIRGNTGPTGAAGPRGLPGLEDVPTDPGVAALVAADDSQTGIAAQTRIDASIDPGVTALLGKTSASASALQVDEYVKANLADVPLTPTNVWYGYLLNPRWKTAVERVNSGAGSAKVLCIGDSTTYGTSAEMPNGYMNERSWPTRMAQYLARNVATSIYGLSVPPSDGSSVPERTVDSRWVLGAGWTRSSLDGISLGGMRSAYNGAPGSGPLEFNEPRTSANRWDIYYLTITSSTMGQFTAQATGGSAVVVEAGNQPTRGVAKVTISAPASGTGNILSIRNTGASGNIRIIGIEPYLDGASRIRVANAGSSGSTTATWLQQASGTPPTSDWNVLGFLPTYQPDLTIIDLGINDAPTVPVADYLARMQTLANAAYATGSAVLIKTMIPSGGTNGRREREAEYVQALINDMSPRYPVLDLFNHYGPFERNEARGWMNDTVHGNDAMYYDVGSTVAETLFRYSGH